MQTTAGSLALVGVPVRKDAVVAERLRRAGAVILGKTNLSEWANFRSTHSSSGWSGRGGQTKNPHALDRSPCGSSSGSAVAVAAALAPVAVGTETDGSILCPAGFSGVVGIKPTVGLTSREGVIPISRSQDTVGPFGRTVADAAALLSVLQEEGSGEHQGYAECFREDGLKGARIGVARGPYFGYSPQADEVCEEALDIMRDAGAEIIDPADIPTALLMKDGSEEMTVLLYEFKAGLAEYFQGRSSEGPQTLADIIAFNFEHAEVEMPFFGQELMLQAVEKGDLHEPEYLDALAEARRLSRQDGIDDVMERYHLDALVMPTAGPPFMIDLINGDHFTGASSQPAALAGYPAVSVPAGYRFGLPLGITFIGRAFTEAVLIRLAHAFELAAAIKQPALFLETYEL